MSAKIVKAYQTACPDTYVYLYRDSDWQEYSVSTHKKSDSRWYEGQVSYHGDDKEEAIESALYRANQIKAPISVRAEHPYLKVDLTNIRFDVGSNIRSAHSVCYDDGFGSWFASSDYFGTGRNQISPEMAIYSLLRANGCTNIQMKR